MQKIQIITKFLLYLMLTIQALILAQVDPIDVIFVCHPKDLLTLDLAIAGIKQNGENIRRVIVVSHEKLTNQAKWHNETNYPFSKLDIALEIFNNDAQLANDFIQAPNSRIGWIYQQLLKLYAPFVIPNISSNVLAIDADTIFLNPVSFINQQNQPLLNYGTEYHKPYFEHAQRLLPGFKKTYPALSGITHHMLFKQNILSEIFKQIESIHHAEPWRAICRCIDRKQIHGASFSEYEIYFNLTLSKINQAKIRPLKWINTSFNIQKIHKLKRAGYHYVSFHEYLQ